MAPRARFADSLDKSLAIAYDKEKCVVCLESKVFGIGMEAYTVGSSEFTVNYASSRGIISLMDNGHYHPTEVVSDKIPSMLLFNKKIALHITRPVRWDSDHVVLFDDETKEIAKEIIRCDAIDRVFIGLDFFDASINRVAAWVIGMRNMQKALLYGLLTPYKELAAMQDEGRFTEVLMQQEELKTYPFSDIWDYYCEQQGVPVGEDWFKEVSQYEKDVMLKRS
jgi:L-rhamnose isomerase